MSITPQTIMGDLKDLQRKLKEVERFLKQDAPEIMGTEAVNHFKKNFEKQSFDGKKWKEVERRKPDSPWYGFVATGKQTPPDNHPKRKDKNGNPIAKPYKKRKESPITGFERQATVTPILSSQQNELRESLNYEVIGPGKVKVYSDAKDKDGNSYSKIHNEGGTFRVFGNKTTKMPKRQFLGDSKPLKEKIQKELIKEIEKIMKS